MNVFSLFFIHTLTQTGNKKQFKQVQNLTAQRKGSLSIIRIGLQPSENASILCGAVVPSSSIKNLTFQPIWIYFFLTQAFEVAFPPCYCAPKTNTLLPQKDKLENILCKHCDLLAFNYVDILKSKEIQRFFSLLSSPEEANYTITIRQYQWLV